ncbi:MAG: guanylate kinase [Pseudomonadota bacterium]
MPYTRSGVVLVLCAPSGTGKTTLTKRLLEEFPDFAFSISCTTRGPRTGEVDGRDYHFISVEEFLRRRDAGFFAEWAEVHGNYYGTPLEATRAMLAAGKDVLFDIDVQGARQVRETMPQATFVFILPPSMEELERRLRSRGTDDDATIMKRLRNAGKELRNADFFDAFIMNDDIDTAYAALKATFVAATLAPQCCQDMVQGLLKSLDTE